MHLPKFETHNAEVRKLWSDYHAGNPERTPMIAGVSDRYYVLNRTTNPKNISFYEYSNDPNLMFNMQCVFAEYARFHIPGDHEMGIPDDGWIVNIDFQNYYEAAWYGCETKFLPAAAPYAVPMLDDENKEMLFAKGLPDPFGGFMAKAKAYYDTFTELAKKKRIMGQKIKAIGAPFTWTDGMFTIACELRGAENICIDMYEDPDYYHCLMEYLTQSTAQRMKAWRNYIGAPEISSAFSFADDSIQLLSHDMYQTYVLPYHLKLARLTSTMQEKGFVHLCGDATRHFATIRDALNIYTFDTGFPVDHRAVCETLGPEVCIQGGPPATQIKNGSIEEIYAESKRILDEVKPVSKKFIFREGNDIPPYTPLENIYALYHACKKFGRYHDSD